jgi:hypothetical protein
MRYHPAETQPFNLLETTLQNQTQRGDRFFSPAEKMVMVDADDARLKAEIDEIVQNIDVTMKKIEQVVPLNPVSSGQAEADEDEQKKNPLTPENHL